MTELDSKFASDIKAFGVLTAYPPVAEFKISAPSEININLNGAVGRLFEKDGELYFEGDLHESAALFFDYLCKNFWIDIKNLRVETARAQANEKEAIRQLVSCRGFD